VSNFKLPSEYQSGNTIHVSSPGTRGARGDRKKIMSHHIQDDQKSERADPHELDEKPKKGKKMQSMVMDGKVPRFMRPTQASKPKENRESRQRNLEMMGKPARFGYQLEEAKKRITSAKTFRATTDLSEKKTNAHDMTQYSLISKDKMQIYPI
jgi:hypothetical protein